MKLCAVVAEYNPFHNGHLYHINKIRQDLQPDYIAAVMSGSFTQRGEPAIIDKFARTEAALACGVDIVLELPVCYSTQPAEYFALGAVSILNASGIVTHLSFGTEADGDEHRMIRSFSEWMYIDKSPQKDSVIGAFVRQGLAYPAACISAYAKLKSVQPESLSVLTKPNAILESAYMGALMRQKSAIEPWPVKRCGAQYHDSEITGTVASATAVRKAMHEGRNDWMEAVPAPALSALSENTGVLSGPESLYPVIKAALLTHRDGLADLPDSSAELANNLVKSLKASRNLQELIGGAATRRYTRARIARLLIHLLLGIDAANMGLIRKKLPGYIRVLGVKKEASGLLGLLSKESKIPVIIQPAGFTGTKLQHYMLCKDILATDIYHACCTGSPGLVGRDYTNKFISI